MGESRRWFRRLPRRRIWRFQRRRFRRRLARGRLGRRLARRRLGWRLGRRLGPAGVGGWRGGWGGGWRGAGWGWRRPWAGYYRPWRRAWPWYGAGLIGAGWGLALLQHRLQQLLPASHPVDQLGLAASMGERLLGWLQRRLERRLGRLGLVSPRLISVREALSPRPHRGRLDRLISALVLSQRRFGSPAQMRTRAEELDMSKLIKAAAAAGALLISVTAHSGVASAAI